MEPDDEKSLRKMLYERKPAEAIVEKAVTVIRKLADRPQAGGTVGKQLSSVILPYNSGGNVITGYHSMRSSTVAFFTPQAVSTREMQICMARPEIKAERPFIFPKVSKNALCPCGSGKKYKNCHGRQSTNKNRWWG